MNMTWWPCPERAQESSCGASERSLCCDCHWHVRLRTFLCWSYFSLIGLDPCWAEQQSTSTSYLIKRALDSSHNTISMCNIQAFYWRHVCYILRTFMVVVHTKIDCTSRVDDQVIPHFANLGARISPNPETSVSKDMKGLEHGWLGFQKLILHDLHHFFQGGLSSANPNLSPNRPRAAPS